VSKARKVAGSIGSLKRRITRASLSTSRPGGRPGFGAIVTQHAAASGVSRYGVSMRPLPSSVAAFARGTLATRTSATSSTRPSKSGSRAAARTS
jgi:hypothetical protein